MPCRAATSARAQLGHSAARLATRHPITAMKCEKSHFDGVLRRTLSAGFRSGDGLGTAGGRLPPDAARIRGLRDCRAATRWAPPPARASDDASALSAASFRLAAAPRPTDY